MRAYGGRFIKKGITRESEDRREMRDAVVFSVDATNRFAAVKIQGSNTQIKAFYPLNWETTPQWLKPGNAVRISTPGGNRGRIEIVGHGFLLPTAVAGGTVTPTPETPGDMILTGVVASAMTPAGMSASISPGTYRIDGVTYTLGAVVMDRSDLEMDLPGLVMDGGADVVYFDAASALYYRYDMIVVGTDGDAHVVKGTNFAAGAEGDLPLLPGDHVMVAWVLIYPNMTTITPTDINRDYTDPAPATLTAVPADSELAWAELSTSIALKVKDQYGNPIAHGGAGYYITMTFVYGNGTLTKGLSSTETTISFYMTSGSDSITYTRDQLVGDVSPMFTVSDSITGFSTAFLIKLLDGLGIEMY